MLTTFNAFSYHILEIYLGSISQPIRISDLKKVDPIRACEYFNSCFKDPSAFTVVIVGKIDPAISLPLICSIWYVLLHLFCFS
jgi:hypothetical protein